MSEASPEDTKRRELGEKIDRLRRAQSMTIAQLAQRAGYDERTVRYVIRGEREAKPETVRHICEAVGLDAPQARLDLVEFADEAHGGYSGRDFAHYLGHYAAYRWSYTKAGNAFRSTFELEWSALKRCMVFREHHRYLNRAGKVVDYSQDGEVYANDDNGLIHLLTIGNGALRLITITRLQEGVMRGGVLTQSRAAFHTWPAMSPILFRKLPSRPSEDGLAGEVLPSDEDYAELASELHETERGIMRSMSNMAPIEDAAKPLPAVVPSQIVRGSGLVRRSEDDITPYVS